MKVKKVFTPISNAFNVLHINLRKKVFSHAFILSLISIADFIGLAILLPLLISLLGGSLHKDPNIPYSWIDISNSSSLINLYTFLAFVMVFFTFKTLFYLNQQNHQVKLISQIIRNISSENIRRFFNLPYDKKLETNSSLFIEKVYFQPFFIGQGVFVPLFILLQETIILLFIISALLVFYPLISFALMVVVLLSGFIIKKWIKQHTVSLGKFNIEKRKELFEKLSLNLSSILDIKQNQLDQKTEQDISEKVHTLVEGELKTNIFKNIPFRVNELIAVIGLIFMILYAVFYNKAEDFILLGSIFALALFRAIPAVNRMQLNLVQFRLNYSHLLNYIEEKELQDFQNESISKLKDKITLQNISIAYKDNSKYILKNVSFEIPMGKITLFTGPSGSGKTSLLRIISGQMEPKSGTIFVDNAQISKYNINSWQSQIAFIPQKPYILKSTISENVIFGSDKEKDCDKIINALKISGLEIFSHNFETYSVGEEGLKISEGQKQRLMLARAIYKDTPILLLDEITGNLDKENIEVVINAMKQLKQSGKTIIAISHNQNVINIADRLCTFAGDNVRINDNG